MRHAKKLSLAASRARRDGIGGTGRRPADAFLEPDPAYHLRILSGAGRHHEFGPNQCKNDKDGTIDPDERLPITGVTPGIYDAKLKDVSGRTCVVRNIEVKAGRNLLDRGERADLLHTLMAWALSHTRDTVPNPAPRLVPPVRASRVLRRSRSGAQSLAAAWDAPLVLPCSDGILTADCSRDYALQDWRPAFAPMRPPPAKTIE